jgi:hypothetical protein
MLQPCRPHRGVPVVAPPVVQVQVATHSSPLMGVASSGAVWARGPTRRACGWLVWSDDIEPTDGILDLF